MGRPRRVITAEWGWADTDHEQGLRAWVNATRILLKAQERRAARLQGADTVAPDEGHAPCTQKNGEEDGATGA